MGWFPITSPAEWLDLPPLFAEVSATFPKRWKATETVVHVPPECGVPTRRPVAGRRCAVRLIARLVSARECVWLRRTRPAICPPWAANRVAGRSA